MASLGRDTEVILLSAEGTPACCEEGQGRGIMTHVMSYSSQNQAHTSSSSATTYDNDGVPVITSGRRFSWNLYCGVCVACRMASSIKHLRICKCCSFFVRPCAPAGPPLAACAACQATWVQWTQTSARPLRAEAAAAPWPFGILPLNPSRSCQGLQKIFGSGCGGQAVGGVESYCTHVGGWGGRVRARYAT